MGYYILYPRNKKDKVILQRARPSQRMWKSYGFAEGPYTNLTEVKKRLSAMNVPIEKRPKNCR